MKKNIINQYSEKDIINANKQVYSKIARTYEGVVFSADANSRLFLVISDCIKYLRKTKKDLLDF